MLWILITAMTALAAAGLILPLARRNDAQRGMKRGPAGAVEVLKGELADLDARAAARTLGEGEAAGLRAEVLRRILAESGNPDAPARPLGERARIALGLVMAGGVAAAAVGLYLTLGRPDLAGVSAATPAPTTSGRQSGPSLAGMVPLLEAKMKASPNDPRGWRLLGWSYMRLGRYADAAGAYGRAATLDPANAEYPSAWGEALTQAAGGQVTAEARDAFKAALAKDGGDPRARYFLAVARDQGGDHAGAMADWIALLKSAPPGAPWAPDVRASVERIVKARGEDIAGELPSAEGGAQVGPIQAMPAPAQRAMIAVMVERLAARLKAHPRDRDGWIALMRARMVLGEAPAAAGAYRDAVKAFAGSPAQQLTLRDAARGLAVPGA